MRLFFSLARDESTATAAGMRLFFSLARDESTATAAGVQLFGLQQRGQQNGRRWFGWSGFEGSSSEGGNVKER